MAVFGAGLEVAFKFAKLDPFLGVILGNLSLAARVALVANDEYRQVLAAVLADLAQPHVQSVEGSFACKVKHDDDSLGFLIKFVAHLKVFLLTAQIPHVELVLARRAFLEPRKVVTAHGRLVALREGLPLKTFAEGRLSHF